MSRGFAREFAATMDLRHSVTANGRAMQNPGFDRRVPSARYLSRYPNFSRALRVTSGLGALTRGNLSFQS